LVGMHSKSRSKNKLIADDHDYNFFHNFFQTFCMNAAERIHSIDYETTKFLVKGQEDMEQPGQ
jgi:hypothetical protein